MTDPTTQSDFRNDDLAEEDRPAKNKRRVPPTNEPGRQVGGTHYQAAWQHWDWVEYNGLGYLEGQITKYVMRWRKKNGAQDLEKAIHYLDKLMELSQMKGRKNRAIRNSVSGSRTEELFKETQLPPAERSILLMILHWQDRTILIDTKLAIQALIDGAAPNQVQPVAWPKGEA